MKPNYSLSSNVRVQRGAAGWTWRSCCAVAMPCGGEAPSRQPARSACAHPARRQVTCIFHSLGFITSWNADLARRAMRGFASLRVYFRCRVFFCQVRSAAKLVRESRDVWLRFGRAGGNRAPLSADAAARCSTCSPAGAGARPPDFTGTTRVPNAAARAEGICWIVASHRCRMAPGTANASSRLPRVPRASARPAARGSGRSPRFIKEGVQLSPVALLSSFLLTPAPPARSSA